MRATAYSLLYRERLRGAGFFHADRQRHTVGGHTATTRVVDRRHRGVDLHVRVAALRVGAAQQQREKAKHHRHHRVRHRHQKACSAAELETQTVRMGHATCVVTHQPATDQRLTTGASDGARPAAGAALPNPRPRPGGLLLGVA